MSPEELLALYFYGISIRSKDGSMLSTDVIRYQIRSAQEEIERYLSIRLQLKFIEQTVDYYRNEYWNTFPILKVKLPVRTPLSMVGFLNGVEQIRYPREWLNVKRDNEGIFNRKIHIIPTGSISGTSGSVLLSGITAYYGLTAYNDIPNYFTVQYITGFSNETLPFEILDLIGKFAAIKLFHIAGDIVLGQGGISSVSLGIDGLSQSVSTVNSSNGSAYNARIISYLKDIDETLKRLKGYYKGINFTVL
jgi:hypothetical protein